jgi:hypothetical protein
VTGLPSERPSLILHVGFHKTGSSSIQRTFAQLDLPEIQYAKWGVANHSGSYLYSFHRKRDEIYNLAQTPEAEARARERGRELRAQLLKSASTCKKPALMVSAEAMSVPRYEQALGRFNEFIQPHVRGRRVIAYLRPHASGLASQFQQRLKMGSPAELTAGSSLRSSVEMLQRTYGKGGVEFWRFARESLVDGDVVTDLASRLQVTVPKDRIVQSNQSLSAEVVAVLYCHSEFGRHPMGYKGAARVQRMLIAALAGIGTTRFRYAPELLDRILPKLAEDMKWIEDNTGLSMASAPSEGGIRGVEDLVQIARGCEADLLKVLAEVGGSGHEPRHPPTTGAAPRRIASIVDAIKDQLRLKLVASREGARRGRKRGAAVATMDVAFEEEEL